MPSLLLVASASDDVQLNLIALKKAKIVCNFGLSVCNRVKFLMKAFATFNLASIRPIKMFMALKGCLT